MDAEALPEVASQVKRAEAAAEGLVEHLTPLLKISQEDVEKMTGQEQAQLHFTVAQGLAAAYVLFTRATGAPSPRFDLELERLRRYDSKVKAAANETDLAKHSRSLEIDVAAASRFMDAALPERRVGASRLAQARPSRSELGGLKGRKPRKAVETLLRQAAKQETDQLLSDIGGRN